jgi:phosphatidylserine decarboxylase
MKRVVLALQTGLLCLAIYIVAAQLAAFPFPSSPAQPFLGPEERWPTPLVKTWIETESADASFVEFFNRDPEREVPAGANLVAPADGVLKGIYEHEGLDHFTIGLSFWDVHVVRSPVDGIVQSVETEGVSFFKAQSETADLAFLRGKAGPVQTIVTIASKAGPIKVRLITSYWASRIKLFVITGQQVTKGERIGRILLGSSVVLDIQDGYDFWQELGDRLVGGETIILDLEPCPWSPSSGTRGDSAGGSSASPCSSPVSG